MAKTFVWRDGARLTPLMLYWLLKLDAAFYAAFRLHLLVSSGIRTRAEQKALFLSRYVLASQVNGRKVYDWRYAEGRLYGRISPLGTVAAWDSPQANHVLENTGRGALDLRDSGNDPGIMTPGSKRWQWMRDNIRRFNFSNEGDSFGEAWHKMFLLDPWDPVPAGGDPKPLPIPKPPTPTPAPPKEMEDEMPPVFYVKLSDGSAAIWEVFTDPRNGQRVRRLIQDLWLWNAISKGYTNAGQKPPMAGPVLTKAQLETIPLWVK